MCNLLHAYSRVCFIQDISIVGKWFDDDCSCVNGGSYMGDPETAGCYCQCLPGYTGILCEQQEM